MQWQLWLQNTLVYILVMWSNPMTLKGYSKFPNELCTLFFIHNTNNENLFCCSDSYSDVICRLKCYTNCKKHPIETNVCKQQMKMIYFYLRIKSVIIGVGIFVVVFFVLIIIMAIYLKSKSVKLCMA